MGYLGVPVGCLGSPWGVWGPRGVSGPPGASVGPSGAAQAIQPPWGRGFSSVTPLPTRPRPLPDKPRPVKHLKGKYPHSDLARLRGRVLGWLHPLGGVTRGGAEPWAGLGCGLPRGRGQRRIHPAAPHGSGRPPRRGTPPPLLRAPALEEGPPPGPPSPPQPRPPPGSPPLRAVLLGPPGVGKSSLARAFAWPDPPGTPPPHHEGPEPPRERRLQVDGATAALVLYDGDEQAAGGADAVLLVFAVSDRGSFARLGPAARRLRSGTPPAPLILVGNKSDLARARQVSPRETRGLAAVLGCQQLETSAALRHRTEELFQAAVRQARLHRRRLRAPPGPAAGEGEEGGDGEEGGSPPPRRRRSLTGRAKRFFAGLVPLARQRSKSCSDLAAL